MFSILDLPDFNKPLILSFPHPYFRIELSITGLYRMDQKISTNTLLVTTAVAASLLSIGATLGVQTLLQREKRKQLEKEVEEQTGGSGSATSSPPAEVELNELGIPIVKAETAKKPLFDTASSAGGKGYDEELIAEQLSRNRAFLGDEGLAKVRSTFVVIVGAGGVGSWAATMLVRSGVRKVKIIDFDQVTLSSLNRHATATLEDVGTPKVVAMKKFLEKVAPWCEIEPVVALWDQRKPGYDSLLLDSDGSKPDWVIDAIDNIDTKVDLLAYCHNDLKVKVISAMGAGCKSDPTRVIISDISLSLEDPLARVTRRKLKQRGIPTGIPVVFSTEKPSPEKANLMPISDEAVKESVEDIDQLAVLEDFRVRILPVLGPLPAIFGLTIATHILTITGGYPGVTDPTQGGYSLAGKRRTKVYDYALQSLAGQFARLHWQKQTVPVDLNDVGYLIEEVFRGKSAISGDSTRLCLTLWNKPEGEVATIDNLVVLTKAEQKFHEERVLIGGEAPEAVYPAKTIEVVNKRLAEQRYYSQYR